MVATPPASLHNVFLLGMMGAIIYNGQPVSHYHV
jgi:hypothetical protein